MSDLVKRDGNRISIGSLSNTSIVNGFIQTTYQATQKLGFQDLILDFSGVQGAFPNACVPLAGIIAYYQSIKNIGSSGIRVGNFGPLTL